jgi:hypothetical protein
MGKSRNSAQACLPAFFSYVDASTSGKGAGVGPYAFFSSSPVFPLHHCVVFEHLWFLRLSRTSPKLQISKQHNGQAEQG